MSKKIAIIGASGHGKVVANLAKLNGYDEIVFLDDDKSKIECGKYQVIGTLKDIQDLHNQGYAFIVAIGDNHIREKLFKQLVDFQVDNPTLIHPSAVIDDTVQIGKGTVIMANVVINAETAIGEACVLNTATTIDHDCVIHDFVHISPGAHLAGNVEVGTKSWICIGAIIIHQIRIGNNSVVAAGSAALRDVQDDVIVAGCPAVTKKQGENK